MKDLAVDANGDLILNKSDLQYVQAKNAIAQKVRLILSTNVGEWELNENEGINFRAILVKNPSEDAILDTVRAGLRQVDESLEITEYKFETKGRHMKFTFRASNANGEKFDFAVGDLNGDGLTVIECCEDAEEVISAGNALDAIAVCDTDCEVYNAQGGALWQTQ